MHGDEAHPYGETMISDVVRFELVTDEAALCALKAEWDALWTEAQGRHFQRFDVCLLAWRHVARPRHRALRCVVLRDDHKLLLVWPLVTFRRALWTYLMPLGPDAGDYTSILVHDDEDSTALIEMAWQRLCERCAVDFVHLPFINEGTALHRLIMRERDVLASVRHDSWIARLRGEHDWDSFCRSLGTMFRKKPGQLEKRLGKEGDVHVGMLDRTDTEGIAKCVRWMMACKRQWSDRVHKSGDWLFSPYYENFLIATLTHGAGDPAAPPLALIHVVTFNDAPIAALIITHGNPVASAVIGGFDPAFGKFGPGSIAVQHCVEWAFEHHYDVDFGVGSERFKDYWSRGNQSNAWSVKIARTRWGSVSYRVVDALRNLGRWFHAVAERPASQK
jgi:CelD/BcsL family acetyltransferase involved in cellulose biosynthesis